MDSNDRRSAVGVLLAAAMLLQPGLAAAQTIRVSAADFLAPQASAIQQLLRDAGFEPAIQFAPAARSLLMLEQGEVDAEFFRQPGAIAAFSDKLRLIGPLSCSTNYAFVRRDARWVIGKAEDLDGLRIGVLNGNMLAANLLDERGIRHDKIAQRDSMFLMLERGRLDVVIDPERSGLTAIRQLGLSAALERRGEALSNVPNYLVLRSHLADWGPRLDRAASQALSSGRWQQWIGDINDKLGIPRQAGLSCLTAPRPVR